MKTIELTKKHKSKLIEMCKALFPNNDPQINIQFVELWIINIDKDSLYEREHLIEIHWFEFCMTHLLEKLWEELCKLDEEENPMEDEIANIGFDCMFGDSTDLKLCLICTEKHPIDYLYEEFKKIKL